MHKITFTCEETIEASYSLQLTNEQVKEFCNSTEQDAWLEDRASDWESTGVLVRDRKGLWNVTIPIEGQGQ